MVRRRGERVGGKLKAGRGLDRWALTCIMLLGGRGGVCVCVMCVYCFGGLEGTWLLTDADALLGLGCTVRVCEYTSCEGYCENVYLHLVYSPVRSVQ